MLSAGRHQPRVPATSREPSNTSSSLAVSRTRTRVPISRAGTEYRHLPAGTRPYRSARGHSTVPVSNGPEGSASSRGASAAKSSPTLAARYSICRPSPAASASASRAFSSASDPARGTGTIQRRRNRPISPSTPPFS